MLPPDFQSLLQTELKPFERVLWFGQPDRKHAAKENISFAILGLFFGGIPGTFLVVEMINNKYQFPLFELLSLFVIVGFCMLFAPLFAWQRAGQTVYAITSNRAIILKQQRKRVDVRSFEPLKLCDISRKQHANGIGDLIFTHDTYSSSEGDIHKEEAGFLGIPDIREVERILTAMRDENLRHPVYQPPQTP